MEAVAKAAGAKFTVVMLEKIKTDAAKSVSPTAVATSIDNTTKNGAVFVVGFTQQGSQFEVYVDAEGRVVQAMSK